MSCCCGTPVAAPGGMPDTPPAAGKLLSLGYCSHRTCRRLTVAVALTATALLFLLGLYRPFSATGPRAAGYSIIAAHSRRLNRTGFALNPSLAINTSTRTAEWTVASPTIDRAASTYGRTGVGVELNSSSSSSAETLTSPEPTTAPRCSVYIRFFDPLAGIGNKMFQYAGGLGLALRHGCEASLVVDHEHVALVLASMKRAFTLSGRPELKTAPSAAANLGESGWGRYDAGKFDDRKTFSSSSVSVSGYLQSWKYFQPVADRIRREFSLTSQMAAIADSFFKDAGVSSDEVLVGVHVRRGDMVSHPELYSVAPAEFITMAVNHYVAKYGGSRSRLSFLFATNDRSWVDDVIANHLPRNLSVRHLSFKPEEDMAILSRCNHSIVTAGTFGWWSAWLAGGDVVYYRNFMRNTSRLSGGYDEADYYPPKWLGLA